MTTCMVFFHCLRHFPGPTLAAVWELYQVSQVLGEKQDFFLDKLREQCGKSVRTGPSELTIYNSAAVPFVHDSDSPGTKADW